MEADCTTIHDLRRKQSLYGSWESYSRLRSLWPPTHPSHRAQGEVITLSPNRKPPLKRIMFLHKPVKERADELLGTRSRASLATRRCRHTFRKTQKSPNFSVNTSDTVHQDLNVSENPRIHNEKLCLRRGWERRDGFLTAGTESPDLWPKAGGQDAANHCSRHLWIRWEADGPARLGEIKVWLSVWASQNCTQRGWKGSVLRVIIKTSCFL